MRSLLWEIRHLSVLNRCQSILALTLGTRKAASCEGTRGLDVGVSLVESEDLSAICQGIGAILMVQVRNYSNIHTLLEIEIKFRKTYWPILHLTKLCSSPSRSLIFFFLLLFLENILNILF